MSKQLYIDPSAVRAPGSIHFEDIPVNRYQKTVRDEAGNFTKEQLVNIYRDMLTLREFETMINLIKTTGEYEGIAYNHPGPAHLSMGQELSLIHISPSSRRPETASRPRRRNRAAGPSARRGSAHG